MITFKGEVAFIQFCLKCLEARYLVLIWIPTLLVDYENILKKIRELL